MYYLYQRENADGTIFKNVIQILDEGVFVSFIDSDENTGGERQEYLAWLEEGNVPEEWNPEGAE
jgi:hypothetical protein